MFFSETLAPFSQLCTVPAALWGQWKHSAPSLTYDPTVFALERGAGAGDGPAGAGAAQGRAAGGAVERGAWAVGAGRRRAAGQRGARTDALTGHRALEREKEREREEIGKRGFRLHQECAPLIKHDNEE